ncbi:hypothetical protein MHU86_24958 [Fragilaria crotonensis]|nr:hypothetical protein MHU86_24958 [Fragilaria crotonensis]
MATKSAKSEAAHRLLRGLAMRQRALEAGPFTSSTLPARPMCWRILHLVCSPIAWMLIFSPILISFSPNTKAHILAACFPDARPTVQRDFDLAGAALATATVDDAARAASWRWWARYCNECRLDPWLSGCPITVQQQLFMGFAARVRTGYFGVGRQVTPDCRKAIRHVAQARVLAGLIPDEPPADPTSTLPSSPPPILQERRPCSTTPTGTPCEIEAAAAPGFAPDADAFAATVADLIILAFFSFGWANIPSRPPMSAHAQFNFGYAT